MFGALGVGFAIAAPWLGWVPVALVGVQVTELRLREHGTETHDGSS